MSFPGFSARKIRSKGPAGAQVLVVGEAPGEQEDAQLQPFVGASGFELNKLLMEGRFAASACRFTNVIKYRPDDNDISLAFPPSKTKALNAGAIFWRGRYCVPAALEGINELEAEIKENAPKLIIACGDTALWALTGKEGITDWRGSELVWLVDGKTPVIPIYPPALILRTWEFRNITVHDLRKANNVLISGPTPKPNWRFLLRPTCQDVLNFPLAKRLAVDVETRNGHIVCVGIGASKERAICIPFVTKYGTPYWNEEEELLVIEHLRKILHPDSGHEIVGQNFQYDAQFFARDMFVHPKIRFDTMLAQHVLFPGTPKDLAYLSSCYCPYHVFWKDDGREWNPQEHTEEQFWSYCCTDCVKTFEIMEAQELLLARHKQQDQFAFLMELWPEVVTTMLRGVRIDPVRKLQAARELELALKERQEWLDFVIGYPFNPRSPLQMKALFVDQLGIKVRKGKKTKGISFDKHALKTVAEKYPLYQPIIEVLEQMRSLSVFLSTFARAPLDWDGRMRCSFNIGGTVTFRFSSSENPFGSGTNLQNVPSGNRSTTMKMPNMREMFVPDENYTICEIDLSGADAQVVAWEADDSRWKATFRAGIKVHVVNNKDVFGALAGEDGKAEPYYTRVKAGGHATNYCGKARTVSQALGISVAETEAFQRKWFTLHPGIPKWHDRVEQSLATTRSVSNTWGFRCVFFGRTEELLPEAVAWIPQSTIGILINKIWVNLVKNCPYVEVLMQVHDSLVFQVPTAILEEALLEIKKHIHIPVPYKDRLVIQLGLKTSDKSWGHCTERKWPDEPQLS